MENNIDDKKTEASITSTPASAESPAHTAGGNKTSFMDGVKVSCVNPWAMTLALFFGWSTFFAACSGFASKWFVNLPIFRIFLGANAGIVDTTLVASLMSIALAVVALITLKKAISDDSVKDTWKKISNFFIVVTAVYVVDMVAIIIYSLMALGIKGVQGQLWLSNFLPTIIMSIGSAAIAIISRVIAKGKSDLMKVICISAIVIATLAFIISFSQIRVSFYGNGGYSQVYELYDALR